MAIFLLIFIFFAVRSVFAVDQLKTTETLVTSSDSALSSASTTQFTFYIGDNLSGITNPVKSTYFTVSGLYTGSGTFAFTIDSDAATTKTFTLPNVGSTPTPFEFIYKDPSNKINPASAGIYTHTLGMTPSGITAYGLGVKFVETHRFVPPSCADGQPTNEKIKTTETLVTSSDSALSSASTTQFTFYIGDNLSGITNPVKSTYFTVSGLYTGSGTFAFTIDSDAATTKTFTLPNVGSTPTPFEFIYKDPSNKINPASAGIYTHTLGMTPSGITAYGLGVKFVETHRYKPPNCGTGLPATGELTSAVFDTFTTAAALQGPAYNSIMWKGTEGAGKVRFQLATSDCSSGATNYPTCSTGAWSFKGGSLCSSGDWYDTGVSPDGGPEKPVEISCAPANHNNQRYFKYKIQICSSTDCSTAGNTSPIVSDVVVNWAP